MRDRDGIWKQIHSESNPNPLIIQMLASTAFANFCYGAVLGASNGIWQAISSAIDISAFVFCPG